MPIIHHLITITIKMTATEAAVIVGAAVSAAAAAILKKQGEKLAGQRSRS